LKEKLSRAFLEGILLEVWIDLVFSTFFLER
jgi:hypothetical protein